MKRWNFSKKNKNVESDRRRNIEEIVQLLFNEIKRKGIIFFSIKSTRFRKVIILRENYKKRIFFSGWKAKFNLEKFELWFIRSKKEEILFFEE